MNRKLLTVTVAVAFAAIGMFFGYRHLQADAPQAIRSPLFALSLSDLDGQNQGLVKWKGKSLLVNFWATWCTPCVQEMPELSALNDSHALKDTQVIGIGIDSRENISQFANKYKIGYPLYVAGMSGSSLLRQMGDAAGGLPFTVLIGADGQIRKVYLGRLDMQEVRQDVSALNSH